MLRRLGSLVAVIAMFVFAAPQAIAEPSGSGGGGGALLDSPTISLGDLGSSTKINFKGDFQTTTASLSFPVPPGLVPVALTATLKLPTVARSSTMTVTQDDRFISRVNIGPQDVAPVTIPLSGAQVFGNYVSLTLTATVLPVDGYCWSALNQVQMFDGLVKFAGTETQPTTVAAFMPPVLRKLTVALPAKPSQAESDAAVQLISAVQSRYGGSTREYAVVPLPDGATTLPPPSAPLERQIIIKEGPDKGLSLQGNAAVPALLVSGPGGELKNQARLLTDDSLNLALTRKAVAGPLDTKQKIVGNTTTLKEMGMGEFTSIAVWPEVGIDLDQSKFGHSLQGVRVHLIGSYTPLGTNFGGDVTVEVGGETIGRWPSEANATIDHWVDIPDRLLKRSTTLTVGVHSSGNGSANGNNCAEYLPVTLRIDGSTEVQVGGTSTPPLPAGFTSLPQTLMPRVQIGIGANGFADTVRAARIMVGLQRFAAVPLVTQVTSLQDAVASKDPAILIEADDWTQKTIGLPITAENGQINVKGFDGDGKFTSLTLEPAMKVGSLQVVFDGLRSVLIATSSGSAAQLDELLGWLAGDPNRWPGLSGRAIISVAGQTPVAIPIPESELLSQKEPATPAKSGFGLVWMIAGAVVVAAVIGALLILLKVRRRRSKVVPLLEHTPDE